MMLTLAVSDEVVREAQVRGVPVVDFVDMLIDKGLGVVLERPALMTAIERIRALRGPGGETRNEAHK